MLQQSDTAEAAARGTSSRPRFAVILHEPSAAERAAVPAARGRGGRPRTSRHAAATGGAAATIAPAALHTDPARRAWRSKVITPAEIRDRQNPPARDGHRAPVSPANKPGGGNFAAYGQKRQRLVNEGVEPRRDRSCSARAGGCRWARCRRATTASTVARAAEAPAAEVWPFSLRDPLPDGPGAARRPATTDLVAEPDGRAATPCPRRVRATPDWLYDEPAWTRSPRRCPAEDAAWAAEAGGRGGAVGCRPCPRPSPA